MKRNTAGVLLLMGVSALSAHAQSTTPLTLLRTIDLPAGTGKFDHFAIDLNRNRLFIAATGNHSLEILDLNSGKVNESVTGLGKPHGLAWISESGRLYVSDGLQGDLKSYEGSPLKLGKSIKLSGDADDMVYDPKSKLLYVGEGGGNAANPAQIAIVDTAGQSLLASLPVSAHPEGLELDSIQDRVFVNIADSAEVAVIDGASNSQTASWKLARTKDNVPLAYDEQDRLLFVACRTPARLVVLDGNSGKELTDLPSDSGADDLFYDAELHRVYLIAGSGAVDTYEIDAGRAVRSIAVLHTSPGAKTGLFVASQHALYVGAPSVGTKQAEILVFTTK